MIRKKVKDLYPEVAKLTGEEVDIVKKCVNFQFEMTRQYFKKPNEYNSVLLHGLGRFYLSLRYINSTIRKYIRRCRKYPDQADSYKEKIKEL